MWQDDSEATKASSGSTAFAFDCGTGTTCGELDAGTTVPPSKRHSCAREYLLSVYFASAARCQTTVAAYSCLAIGESPVQEPNGGSVSSTRRSCAGTMTRSGLRSAR